MSDSVRRRGPAWAAVAVAVLVAMALAAVAFDLGAPRTVGPNVVVILLDVLRADHLGVYGYERETSPNIDGFAAEAVVFDQAVSQSSFTKTSVASLFSARYPFRHGVYDGSLTDTESNITSDVLPEALPTVAEAFQNKGYTTVAWVQNDQLRPYMGFDQGFDSYRDRVGKVDKVLDGFLGWLRKRRGSFFAYLHVLDIHGPYTPPPPFDTAFGTYSDTYVEQMPRWRTYRREVRDGDVVPSAADIEQLKALYDGEIAAVDAALGGLFDELRRRGLYDESIIVVTSDHGDGFYDHGFVGHSTTPYEELIRVPLIVKLPGGRFAGTRIPETVPLVDLAPTLLDLVGARPMAEIDGVSQVRRMRRAGASADAARRYPNARVSRFVVSEYKDCLAVRDDHWKYLRCGDEEPELFDLRQDPGETENVLASHPEVAERFGQHADAVRTLRRAPEDRVVVDPETVEALKALGYI